MFLLQLNKALNSFKKIEGLLKSRPPKWTPQLESAFADLRPSIESLQQKASHFTGLTVQQMASMPDLTAQAGLAPIKTLAMELEREMKGLEISRALIDIPRCKGEASRKLNGANGCRVFPRGGHSL